jgi:DNA-directed RNA polymerase subunit RPC12/RpoP
MAWFLNQYLCDHCKRKWDDVWSATCDDDCPHCGSRHMTPHHSIDLTEIVQDHNGKFLVYKSLDSAEHSPDYDLIAEFATAEQAEHFLTNGDDESCGQLGPVGFVD